jgi:hypothetical protein
VGADQAALIITYLMDKGAAGKVKVPALAAQ